MRGKTAILALVALTLSLAAGRARAAGAAVGVEVRAGGDAGGGAQLNEHQLRQLAEAAGKAELVVVVKVTEIAEPKPQEGAEGEKKEEGAEANPKMLFGMRPAGAAQKEKTLAAEVSEVLKGDKATRTVKARFATAELANKREMLVFPIEQSFADGQGNVQKVTRIQYLPLTLVKDAQVMLFLKAPGAGREKDAGDKQAERVWELVAPPVKDPAERALAAVKDALQKIADWENPPKLSAADEAEVQKLIADLGSKDYATREAASKALIARGGVVKPLVEAAAKSPDPEVQQRAKDILEALKPECLKPASSSPSGPGNVMRFQGGVGVGAVQVQVIQGGEE